MITVSIIIRIEAEAERQIPVSGSRSNRCPDNCGMRCLEYARYTVRELEKEPRAKVRATGDKTKRERSCSACAPGKSASAADVLPRHCVLVSPQRSGMQLAEVLDV